MTRLVCSSETKILILNDCKEEYLRHHPEMRKVPISQEKILYEVARYYLEH